MPNPVEVEPRKEREEPGAPPPPPPDEPPRPRRRRWLWPALVIFLILAAVAGYFIWTRLAARETTDDAQIDGHVSPISPRVGGTVTAVYVNDNQEVQPASVLFQIDPTDYRVAVERAQADLEDAIAAAKGAQATVPVTSISTSSNVSTAEAGLKEAIAGVAVADKAVGGAEARLRAAQARLAEAQANATRATRDLERYKLLVAKDEISQQQFDAAQAAADAALATVASMRAAVADAEQAVAQAQGQAQQARARVSTAEAAVRAASAGPQQVEATKAQASSAEARVQQREAALEQARLNLAYTTVHAPLAGVVGNKTVEVGQVLQPGQPTLSIIPLDDVWVTANFKESQMGPLRVGQRATISVDALKGREYRGHVDTIAPATGARFSLLPPENATGNYVKVVQRIPVKIVFDQPNEAHLMRPGMSVVPKVWVK
jgi:membrane fusion protein (multidrug efflux system)